MLCKFTPGTGKPLVRKVRLLNDDGTVKYVIRSHNEYKKIREVLKAKKSKAYKESKNK
jgi:hypothetical protein